MKCISVIGSAATNVSQLQPGKASRLFTILEELGYSLTNSPKGDLLLAIDHNEKGFRRFIDSGGDPLKTVLVRLEPESVFPSQYRSSTEKKYLKIFSPGRVPFELAKEIEFGWPYEYRLNPNLPRATDPKLESILVNRQDSDVDKYSSWLNRSIKISMVAANKVSPNQSQNYSIRRNLAKGLPKDVLHVYGALWNDSLYAKIRHRGAVAAFSLRQCYFPNINSIYGNLFSTYSTAHGPIQDKHQKLIESQFSLVIENSNSYVSEKLFDAIVDGSIPIYVGPKLSKLGLPEDIVIASTGDPTEILQIISGIRKNDVEHILDQGKKFLNSELFKSKWTEIGVYSNIGFIISKILEGS